MSTAAPLPLEPLPTAPDAAAEPQALRTAVAERLQQHRRRRGDPGQPPLPGMQAAAPSARSQRAAKNPIASSVAARFAKSVSYRDYLEQEAESATRQAEAIAEIARRNADAVAAAQQQLLNDIAQWDRDHFASGGGAAEAAVVLSMPAERPADINVLAESEALRRLPVEHTEPVDVPVSHNRILVADVVAEDRAGSAVLYPDVQAAVVDRAVTRTAPEVAAPAQSMEPAEPPVAIPANLIEFPRQLVAARKARPRHAEGPLREDADAERTQLRIFEVEASAFSVTPTAEPASSLPEWSTIRLDNWAEPHASAQPGAQVSLALPVYAASVERRLMAAVVDGCCVAAAFVLAVCMAGLAGGVLPGGLLAVGASVVTLLVFGLGYLLLCFSLSGQTVGMRYARIALCTFGDDNPTRSAMRRRLLATALSAGSLGLGFAWALLDDDGLGWHDRISRMYQRAY